MSDYPMLISNKLHSFRNFVKQRYTNKQGNIFLLIYILESIRILFKL